MNWLALSPLEVAGLWTALAGLALWFYLHHRRPLHRKVSTLRFWASVQPIAQPRRRKLREPWALLAQVLFLLLLILALANPRWGVSFEGRSVVIVFDTSIWSQARPPGETPWIDRERVEALRVIDSLPVGDRVLLVRAEPDAPPILPYTTDHVALRRAQLRTRRLPAAPRTCLARWKWPRRHWLGRDVGFWFMLGQAWWMRSRRAAWMNSAPRSKTPSGQ